jgi:hypothetical protein
MVYSGMDAGVDHGDRYWSRILEGEPPEVEEEGGAANRVRPCWEKNEVETWFSLILPLLPAPPPG